VLSFEHAFQIIALVFFAAVLAIPFLPSGRRQASEGVSIDL